MPKLSSEAFRELLPQINGMTIEDASRHTGLTTSSFRSRLSELKIDASVKKGIVSIDLPPAPPTFENTVAAMRARGIKVIFLDSPDYVDKCKNINHPIHRT